MKVYIADKFEKSGIEGLKALGCEVVSEPDVGADKLAEGLARVKPDVLVVRSTKVPKASVEAAGLAGVKFIVRAGAGVDNIDVAAATTAGIRVSNCAGMNAIAVAELTMGLLLACDRRIPDQTIDARAGTWNKKEYGTKAKGLAGSTLGVIGAGAIGRAVVKRAVAFDMRVIVWSRSISREHAKDLGAEWGGTDTPALHALAGVSDAVTIHLPLAPDTKGLIGQEFLAKMKPGAYVINTSRGGVIDEAALREAVKTKGIRAGLDVYEGQPGTPTTPPGEWNSEMARFGPGVYCTHHIGASTDQSQQAIAAETVRLVGVWMSRGKAENCVNG
ncbi:MAG: NAD(P)-dependent oxidoreductase [Phycisphaerales bacterium]